MVSASKVCRASSKPGCLCSLSMMTIACADLRDLLGGTFKARKASRETSRRASGPSTRERCAMGHAPSEQRKPICVALD